jgi:hypothetical protein
MEMKMETGVKSEMKTELNEVKQEPMELVREWQYFKCLGLIFG